MVEITKKDIDRAKRILPISQKFLIIKESAIECIDKYSNEDGTDFYIEDILTKELIQSKVLLSDYLGIIPKEEVLTLDMYDEYYENNPLNQLERLKNKFKAEKEFELVEKIFDMMTDYNKFCKMFNVEVYSILQAKNNIVDRLLNSDKFLKNIGDKISNETIAVLSEKISEQITPEIMQDSIKQFAHSIEEMKASIDEKNGL